MHSRFVAVPLAAVLLMGAANLGAYAATGGPLLLGKGNTTTKTTELKTTGKGAALSLKSKAGKAPLKVSNSTTVKRLNADMVDGQQASALRTKAYAYDLYAIGVTDSYVQFSLAGLPAGRYAVNYSVFVDVVGAPSFVGCFLTTGAGATATPVATALGVSNGGNGWFVSGGGYVDTTSATYRFTCQRSGGTSMTVPSSHNFPGDLILTRLDDVTLTGTTGVSGAQPRGLAP
jgi:hypothetical protein